MALAELYLGAEIPRAEAALRLLLDPPDWYGETDATRLRALQLLGQSPAAQRLAATSPFLNAEQRARAAPGMP